MTQTGNDLIYWDTCVFLTWILGGDNKGPNAVAGIDELVEGVHAYRYRLITSTLTDTEILRSRLAPEQIDKYDAIFDRSNVERVNLDERIAKLASEIRDYYWNATPKRNLKTPDAIHLATAIYLDSGTLYTFDGLPGDPKETPRPDKLISLNGNIAGQYKMHICAPFAEPKLKQADLFSTGGPRLVKPAAFPKK